MQRARIFNSAECGDDLATFERTVDEWVSNPSRQIQFVTQSAWGAHLIVTVIYFETDTDADHETASAAEVPVPDVFERTLDDDALDPERPLDQPLPELELPY